MLASFLLSLREGLEAALIIGIVLGVLVKTRRTDLFAPVWQGVGAAAVVSMAAALILNLLGMEFEGRGEATFEGAALLMAAGVLTWMIVWMKEHGGSLKQEIELQTSQALRGKSGKALFALAFLAVVREGIELALFLLAVRLTTSPLQTLIGAVLGLGGAAVLGWVLFTSARRLSLRTFFSVTNILLIIFAAGMIGLGIHEFNEAGLIPAVIDPLWNVNFILDEHSELGLILKALVGYNSDPSLTSVLGYLVYMAGALSLVLIRKQRPSPAPVTTNQ